MSDDELATDAAYCAAEVRRHDYDRWLTTLFAPEAARPGLLALYAFNLEIARIRESVSQPMVGEIRLQWWRETLDAISAGRRQQQPVARALGRALQAAPVDVELLFGLLNARERDFQPEPPETMGALIDYAGATSGNLMRAALQLLESDDPAMLAAAQDAGIAYALVGLMRALPHHLAQHRVYLPRDLLQEQGVLADHAAHQQDPNAFRRSIARICQVAAKHFTLAGRQKISRSAMPALLPGRLGRLYLSRLAAADFDPESPRLVVGTPTKQLATLGAILRGRI